MRWERSGCWCVGVRWEGWMFWCVCVSGRCVGEVGGM